MGSRISYLFRVWLIISLVVPPGTGARADHGAQPQRVDRETGSPGDCFARIDSEQQRQLLAGIEQIRQDHAGDSSQRDLAIGELVDSLNPSNDPTVAGVLRALVVQNNQAAGTAAVMALVMKKLLGEAPTQNELDALKGFGVEEDPAEYVEAQAEQFKPYLDTLTSAGAKFNADTGWDLTEVNWSADSINQNPRLKTALMLFFSPTAAEQLSDPNRTEAVQVGNTVFYPPGYNRSEPDRLVTETRERYDRTIQEELGRFRTAVEEFIAQTNAVNTYSNMMTGRVWEIFGGERGYNGRTAPEIAQRSAYSDILRITQKLRRMGVERNLQRQLLEAQQTALRIEAEAIDSLIGTLNRATYAAIAAPFIPIAMAAAPFAGALLSAQAAAAAATTAANLALLPLVLSAGTAAVFAGIDTLYQGGSFFCRLAENLATHGSTGLIAAPFMAALPSATALATVGTTAGLTAAGFGSATLATTVHGVISTSMALTFLGTMSFSAGSNGAACYQSFQRSSIAASEGNEDLANEQAARGWQQCVQAGIDLTFAVMGARQLARMNRPAQTQQQGSGQRSTNSGQPARPPATGLSEPTANSALTGMRNGGGHAIRHLQSAGMIPSTGSLPSRVQIFAQIARPILTSPTQVAPWRIGGTQGTAYLGQAPNGQTVAIVVANEGPFAGKVVSAFLPDANQLAIMMAR